MVKIASVALAALLVIIHKVKADVYSDAALASHNDVRQSYSAPGLTWNVALAADAKKHAELCRDTPSEGATKGQVGCAQFECPKGTMTTSTGYKAETAAAFTVCRYSPPGNIAGQFAKNVNKPKTK
ncbi:hypothetical protein BG005_005039 [Podila minutissima]|nr:hypothetical protein BG005_005039 [Podila minutissima]